MRLALALTLSLTLSLMLLAPRDAVARTTRDLGWSFAQIWPSALRFLRVDERLEITERDADAGYLLFVYASDGKRFTGALELVRVKDAHDRDIVRLVLSIRDRPAYLEEALLDRLARKLRTELGDPPPAPRKEKPPAPGAAP